jgi:hypothetical protein
MHYLKYIVTTTCSLNYQVLYSLYKHKKLIHSKHTPRADIWMSNFKMGISVADKQIVKKNVASGEREQQSLFQDIISMSSTTALLISIHWDIPTIY